MLNQLAFLLFFLISVNAESHTIAFDNRCGFGTPTLIQGGNIMTLVNNSFTSQGSFSSAIAYLQTGKCGFNGEDCLMVEMNMNNPACPGCGSSADLTLIPPHAFSVPTAFGYYNGCDGTGATCASGTCDTAFFNPNDNQVQVACQTDNVDLLITFCGEGSSASETVSSSASSSATSSSPASSSAASSFPASSSAASISFKASSTQITLTTTSATTSESATSAPASASAAGAIASNPTVSASGGGPTAVCRRRRNVKSQALRAHRHRRRLSL